MALVKIPRAWEIPESDATPESVYLNRRRFLQSSAVLGLGAIAGAAGCGVAAPGAPGAPVAGDGGVGTSAPEGWKKLYPAPRVPKYTLDRPLTDEAVAGRVINFYEFTTDKEKVADLAKDFPWHPWTVEIAGLVKKPRKWDIDDLVKTLPLEERLYRHRCVERWSMAVPWTGFPLAALIGKVEPLSSARFVRFVSFLNPEKAPGQALQSWYKWPYYEGLTMAEATNELTMLVTGIYGHPLPMHHGAPIRLITPWKYGYKSIKSIVRIEFVEKEPATFWNDVAPTEYDFTSNVNPGKPHPRWSQEQEQLIGTEQILPTLLYNGYGDYVKALYS